MGRHRGNRVEYLDVIGGRAVSRTPRIGQTVRLTHYQAVAGSDHARVEVETADHAGSAVGPWCGAWVNYKPGVHRADRVTEDIPLFVLRTRPVLMDDAQRQRYPTYADDYAAFESRIGAFLVTPSGVEVPLADALAALEERFPPKTRDAGAAGESTAEDAA